METQKKPNRILTIFIILALLCLAVCGGILLVNYLQNRVPEDAKRIDVIITEVHIYEGGVTLYVSQNGRTDRIRLQEDTIIKDQDGKKCSVEVLEAGQTIWAVVDSTVMYEAWQDIKTGQNYSANIYSRCYQVIIK